jgi:peroxiredoxin
VWGGTGAQAAKFNRVLEIGSDAPVWKELPGVDGKPHGLDEYKSAKVVVVIFMRNHCPIARGYTERFVQFTRDYAGKGVAVVAINVSRLPDEDLDKMRSHAKEKQFNFPYLRDQSQKIGQAYGATVTPHLFVLDARRKIAYMGAFDDNPQAAKAEQSFVREAVDAVLAGKALETEETLQRGCFIEYDE